MSDEILEAWMQNQPKPSKQEVLNALIRERKMREDNYPKWMREGRMKGYEAAHQIKCIDEAIVILKESVASSNTQLSLGL
jgi:hypothetical protein